MRPDVNFGSPIYPSPSGGTGVANGQIADEVFYPCQQCGFWCQQSQVESSGGTDDGDGGVIVTVTNEVGDPTVSSGCPFCGSANSFKG